MGSATKMAARSLGLVLHAVMVAFCANGTFADSKGGEMPAKTIEWVLKENSGGLMSLPGVVGTAQGLCGDQPCIKVLVIKKTPELNGKIPDVLDGYLVRMEEVGEIQSLPKNQEGGK